MLTSFIYYIHLARSHQRGNPKDFRACSAQAEVFCSAQAEVFCSAQAEMFFSAQAEINSLNLGGSPWTLTMNCTKYFIMSQSP